VKGDAALAAKTIRRLGTEWELLEYKGGLMEGEELDPDSFTAIAKLPGRDALNAQFAGVVASPLTGLVRGLGSMIQGLALQLGQIAEKGLVTGEPPAEEPAEAETPAGEEEAPAGEGDEETPKEDGAPAAADAEEGSGEQGGGGEDAPSDAGAEGEEASSNGEADAPSAAESPPDPEPAESPEERSEEEAPAGEEAGQSEPEATGEGDQDLGEEPAAGETSEDSDDENKEEVE
jgi:hypothetical protein